MSLNDAVSDDQLATMQGLAATRVLLEVNRKRVTKLRDQVKVQREAAAANLVRKQQLEAAAEDQRAQVAELVVARKGARKTAARLREADKKQLASLESDRRSLEAKIRALTPKQVNNAGGDGGGTLSYPVSGYPITSPYGMRFHPVLHVWKLHDGTDFGAGCGTPIRAPATGRVASVSYNAGYGNRLMLDHEIGGRRVRTGYNHATRYVVRPGTVVRRGQLLGYVGTTGYSTGCHLHLMLWVGGRLANPMTMF
jgi:murein DD-endopeptidase MepM/ murein hydrolase activator NlpD